MRFLIPLLLLLPLGACNLPTMLENLGADLDSRFDAIEQAQEDFRTGQISRAELDAALARERLGIQGDVLETVDEVRQQYAQARQALVDAGSAAGGLGATIARKPLESALGAALALAGAWATRRGAITGARRQINEERDLKRRLRQEPLDLPPVPPPPTA